MRDSTCVTYNDIDIVIAVISRGTGIELRVFLVNGERVEFSAMFVACAGIDAIYMLACSPFCDYKFKRHYNSCQCGKK